MTNEQNRAQWEERSRLWGDSLRSVLFKGLPEALNEHIHRWHTGIVIRELAGTNNARILDVGCGYGRLTHEILSAYPEADVMGIDLTENYVRLYRERTGRAAQTASIEELPAALGKFDVIVCVTVLMYVDPTQTRQALNNLVDRLDVNGKLIVIEPHTSCLPWQTAFGLLTLARRKKSGAGVDTGGRHFGTAELDGLIDKAGCSIIRERRMPFTTVFMLPLFAVCAVVPTGVARMILRCAAGLDALLGKLPLPTLYRALTLTRSRI